MQESTHHYEYLLDLGEVRATQVVATLVDGVQGHTNRDKGTVDGDESTVDMIHLPMTMGYRNCYKRYMASLDPGLTRQQYCAGRTHCHRGEGKGSHGS